MTGLKYWLEHEADEYMPEGMPSPDAFILERDGDHFIIGRKQEEGEEEPYRARHKIGDVIEFLTCAPPESITVHFGADGSFTPPAYVPEGTCWIRGDHDTTTDSLEEISRLIKDGDIELEGDGENLEVQFAKWSSAHFLLAKTEGGKGATFIRTEHGHG